MKQFTMIMVVLFLGISLETGCQESDASQIRRARLVANENIQLKKELKEKDQQIEDLKMEIKKNEEKSSKEIEKSSEASLKSMRLLMESEKRAEGLVIENRKLKEELEKLKAQ